MRGARKTTHYFTTPHIVNCVQTEHQELPEQVEEVLNQSATSLLSEVQGKVAVVADMIRERDRSGDAEKAVESLEVTGALWVASSQQGSRRGEENDGPRAQKGESPPQSSDSEDSATGASWRGRASSCGPERFLSSVLLLPSTKTWRYARGGGTSLVGTSAGVQANTFGVGPWWEGGESPGGPFGASAAGLSALGARRSGCCWRRRAPHGWRSTLVDTSQLPSGWQCSRWGRALACGVPGRQRCPGPLLRVGGERDRAAEQAFPRR